MYGKCPQSTTQSDFHRLSLIKWDRKAQPTCTCTEIRRQRQAVGPRPAPSGWLNFATQGI